MKGIVSASDDLAAASVTSDPNTPAAGLHHTALAAAEFKVAFKIIALCWVLEGNGDIYSVAKTLVWTEIAVSVFPILACLA